MSDKSRSLFPISVSFVEGEQPTHTKLNGITTQTQAGLRVVALMLGDLWNQAGDQVLSPSSTYTKNALHQVNLARSIGQMNLLNPLLLSGSLNSGMEYTDVVGNRYQNLTRAKTLYPPFAVPDGLNITITGSGTAMTTWVATAALVRAAGDYFISSAGYIYTYSAIPFATTLTYVPTLLGDLVDIRDEVSVVQNIGWNVIPDPATSTTSNYNGCKISFANGVDNTSGYHIWLPPRKELYTTVKRVYRTQNNTSNTTITPESTPIQMYQSTTSDAALVYGDHYRYNLPKALHSLSAGTVLPEGYLYLWNEDTGTIIEGVTLAICATAGHRKWKLVATGAVLTGIFGTTVGNGIITSDATQTYTDYISTFRVIAGAIGATQSGMSHWRSYLNHTHDDGLTPPVSHTSLDGLVTPIYNATTNPSYTTLTPSFPKSVWTGDDHPQYLHRAGAISTQNPGTYRDKWGNAIFLAMAIVDPSTGTDLTDSTAGYLQTDRFHNHFGLHPTQNNVGIFLDNRNISDIANDVMNTYTAYIRIANEVSGGTITLDGSQGIRLRSNGSLPVSAKTLQVWGAAGVANLYFSTSAVQATSESTVDSNTKIQHTSGTYRFVTGGTTDSSVGEFGSASVKETGLGYVYRSTGKTQYYTVQPTDGVLSLGTTNLQWTNNYVRNTDGASSQILEFPIHLPHGAIVRTTHTQTIVGESNGIGDNMVMTLREITKSDGTSTARGTVTITATSTTAATFNATSNITIDSNTTGNFLVLQVNMPYATVDYPYFLNATITYDLPAVNN